MILWAIQSNIDLEELVFVRPLKDLKEVSQGLLRINVGFILSEGVSTEEAETGLLETVFLNGKVVRF